MSARDRAHFREFISSSIPGVPTWFEQGELIKQGSAPKSMIQRQERREWLINNLSEELFREAEKAHEFLFESYVFPEEVAGEALEKLSAGLLGITSLIDNPLKVKERLPKLQALLTEALEELTALGIWTRSPNSSKLSE